jgi:hypothetical protein
MVHANEYCRRHCKTRSQTLNIDMDTQNVYGRRLRKSRKTPGRLNCLRSFATGLCFSDHPNSFNRSTGSADSSINPHVLNGPGKSELTEERLPVISLSMSAQDVLMHVLQRFVRHYRPWVGIRICPMGYLAGKIDFPPLIDSHPSAVWRQHSTWFSAKALRSEVLITKRAHATLALLCSR